MNSWKKDISIAALLLPLVFSSFDVLAQKLYVGKTDDRSVYVEVSSIRHKADYEQVWVEYNDLKISRASTSSKVLMIFRCEEEEMAVVSFVEYSKPFGEGRVISSGNKDYPVYGPIVPGAVGDVILTFVCAYQKGESWAVGFVSSSMQTQDLNSGGLIEGSSSAAEAAAAAADAAISEAEAAADRVSAGSSAAVGDLKKVQKKRRP